MADSSFYNSNASGFSQPTTGASSTWDDFYRGITPTASKSPTFQPGMLGRGLPASYGVDRLPQGTAGLPNPSPGSGLTPSQVAALGGYTVDPRTGKLNYITPTAQPTQVASTTPPVPLNRPSAFANYMDDPAYAAAYLEQYGVPPPTTAVAAELATAPPAGGQLAALLEAAQGLGGLLSGVTGGGSSPATTRAPVQTPQQKAAAYNAQSKSGFSDWGVSGSGQVFSKGIMDKHTTTKRSSINGKGQLMKSLLDR